MPLRMLRPGIITSEAVNKLSANAEVFYRRLMSIVDDWGRYDGRVSILRPTCYPLQLDRVREADVQRGIAECEEAGLVRLYTVEGKPYVQMLKWDKPRAKSSKWPDPPEDVKACAYTCSHMFPDTESDTESETSTPPNSPEPGEFPPTTPPKRKVFVPPTPQEATAYAASIGFKLDGEKFVAHYQARGWKFGTGKPVVDWKACVVTWKKRDESGGGPDVRRESDRVKGTAGYVPGKYSHLG